ncbi:hypothetical protein ACHAWF_005175 [Thalassiosira exigua]
MDGNRNRSNVRRRAQPTVPLVRSVDSNGCNGRVASGGRRRPRESRFRDQVRGFARRKGRNFSRISRMCRKLGQLRVVDVALFVAAVSKLASVLYSMWRVSSSRQSAGQTGTVSLSLEPEPDIDEIVEVKETSRQWKLSKWARMWADHRMPFHSPLLYRREDDDYSFGHYSYLDDDDLDVSSTQRKKNVRFKGMFRKSDTFLDYQEELHDQGYVLVDDVLYKSNRYRDRTKLALAHAGAEVGYVVEQDELEHSDPAFEYRSDRKDHLQYIDDDGWHHYYSFDDDFLRGTSGMESESNKRHTTDGNVKPIEESGDANERDSKDDEGDEAIIEEAGMTFDKEEVEYKEEDGNVKEIDSDDQKENVTKCSQPSFYRLYHPTCNELHASLSGYQWLLGEEVYSRRWKRRNHLSLERSHPSKYLSHGYYRDAFLFQRIFASQNEVGKQSTQWDKVVFKTMRHMYKSRTADADDDEIHESGLGYDPEDKYTFLEYREDMRKDAMVMELLSSSPRAIDLYSHCAMSSVIEFAPTDIEKTVLPTKGYSPKMFVRRESENEDDLEPLNDHISPIEKLEIALEMAKCLAAMHGFEDGVIAHSDVQLGQFFRGRDGMIKFVDFNRAEPLLYDTEHDEYCKWKNGKPGDGWFRSPEENIDGPLTEKIDVFSLGNVFYQLLTGRWVWEGYDSEEYSENIIDGMTMPIPAAYNGQQASEYLVRAIKACWTYDPEQRPTVFELVSFLEGAVASSIQYS